MPPMGSLPQKAETVYLGVGSFKRAKEEGAEEKMHFIFIIYNNLILILFCLENEPSISSCMTSHRAEKWFP